MGQNCLFFFFFSIATINLSAASRLTRCSMLLGGSSGASPRGSGPAALPFPAASGLPGALTPAPGSLERSRRPPLAAVSPHLINRGLTAPRPRRPDGTAAGTARLGTGRAPKVGVGGSAVQPGCILGRGEPRGGQAAGNPGIPAFPQAAAPWVRDHCERLQTSQWGRLRGSRGLEGGYRGVGDPAVTGEDTQ